ncbi:prenyltransferase [Desulforamulus ruminis]|uniref:prenyltransferase n=1 Tax=Desulforamulus ruminis TaxID=1564 RepID=UPI003B75BB65
MGEVAVEKQYASDVEVILSHRYDNGGDLWTTPDKRLLKGAPFSTLESVLFLLELGMEPTDPLLKGATELFFSTWLDDGRFKIYPKGSIYPCHTIHAANALCHLGYASDARLQKTFRHLLDIQYIDGGWRCNKFSFGRGPETEHSNPFPTLTALNAFRFSNYLNKEPALDKAVDFLLEHWTIRKPIGPCHYGIGTLFMQVEYPFRNYNLFVYVYVLSFYNRAKKDKRFLEALQTLESKMVDGQIVVERIVPKLAGLSFCKKGETSVLATIRYHEILKNLQTKG